MSAQEVFNVVTAFLFADGAAAVLVFLLLLAIGPFYERVGWFRAGRWIPGSRNRRESTIAEGEEAYGLSLEELARQLGDDGVEVYFAEIDDEQPIRLVRGESQNTDAETSGPSSFHDQLQ